MRKILKQITAGMTIATVLTACGGGGGGTGGGGTYNPPAPTPIVYGPYENVYGEACTTMEASPGCTFFKNSDVRITYSEDKHYNRYGYGRDDLYYVKFDSAGNANVYNDIGTFQYSRNISQFAGFISGQTIGVGTTSLFWENVSNKTYWLGKNGVLYSANQSAPNFGQAINNKDADKVVEASFTIMNSEGNKKLVKRASDRLVKQYGFSQEKARVVASALNNWAVTGAQRGHTTVKDMDSTFKAVFGVEFRSALSALRDLQAGDSSGMADLTDRSANALGLKPHQAQAFIKGMYKKTLASYGVDVESINW
ncbi:MAG: hypothetical protein V4736_06840 [Bdellovibrionota bacterium]